MLALIGYLLALAGASALLLLQDWRRRLLAFLLQSTGVGLLAGTLAPAGVAAVEVLSGWLVGVTIALSVLRARPRLTQESMASASRLFRGLALLMILVAIASLMPDIGSLLGDPPRQITLAAGTLAGTGFLILGLTEHPLTTGLGLVTVLQGLELAYLWSERSLLVVALLAVVNLAVALACTYLHAVESQGRSREEAG